MLKPFKRIRTRERYMACGVEPRSKRWSHTQVVARHIAYNTAPRHETSEHTLLTGVYHNMYNTPSQQACIPEGESPDATCPVCRFVVRKRTNIDKEREGERMVRR